MGPSELCGSTASRVRLLFQREGPGADYEELHILQDKKSGLRGILAVHSTRLGPAFGGIRRMRYPTEEDALGDALRLAEAMTWKCALADLPAGGAKTVILDHDMVDREGLYREVGRHVERFGGRYVCGPDIGTTDEDLDVVREETDQVNPKGNDPGRSTAAGVLAALRGTVQVLKGDTGFVGNTFLVQGLGSVGLEVAAALLDEGATVMGTDKVPERLEAAKERGVVAVPPGAALTTSCDVLVPCALGRIITEQNAPNLRAKAVCGSANNQLASPAAGKLLHKHGVFFAPDIVVSSGAVIEGFFTIKHGAKDSVRRRAYQHIDGIEETVQRILERSQAEDRPCFEVAVALARERLDAATT